MALARPERTRLAFADDPVGGTPIELPRRGVGPAAAIVAGMFAVSLGVLVVVVHQLHWDGARSVADLASLLFRLFWILGWSVGVLVLGAFAVLLCFYRDSLYLQGSRLVSAPRLGPLHMLAEYELAGIRNLRIEAQATEGARVRFDYGEGSRNLGDVMPNADAERIVAMIRAALPSAATLRPEPGPPPAPPAAAPRVAEEEPAEPPLSPTSAFALVAANLVPLLGVLFAGWRLDQVMVLFWAESAVVAFYALVKMVFVGRWLAIPAGLFFLAHFGAFMAIHFLFIYEMFVRGIGARGQAPPAAEALLGIFAPLWPALVALLLSHGISFALDFLGRAEHRGMTLSGLMSAPYRRIVLMQLTLIFGGWVTLLLHDPRPALALLVVLKVGADLYAHRRERQRPLSLA